MLNLLWLGFFIVAAVSALAQWLLAGQAQVFAAMVESLFTMAKLSVEVMVLLFGTLTMWLGFLRIAEKAGIVDALARWLLAPASVDEVRRRQAAVAELRSSLQLREDIAVLGASADIGVHPAALLKWAETPNQLTQVQA